MPQTLVYPQNVTQSSTAIGFMPTPSPIAWSNLGGAQGIVDTDAATCAVSLASHQTNILVCSDLRDESGTLIASLIPATARLDGLHLEINYRATNSANRPFAQLRDLNGNPVGVRENGVTSPTSFAWQRMGLRAGSGAVFGSDPGGLSSGAWSLSTMLGTNAGVLISWLAISAGASNIDVDSVRLIFDWSESTTRPQDFVPLMSSLGHFGGPR